MKDFPLSLLRQQSLLQLCGHAPHSIDNPWRGNTRRSDTQQQELRPHDERLPAVLAATLVTIAALSSRSSYSNEIP
ncbi:uncharacterized protein ARMOST_01459 [Armillaria ostoyae]|uniref:Uncharacterized protein n=2 Tax=Armillaria TaxID=47424 RepID=A0A284QP21_ARMOS|nr:hypothetical protein ARMSODRAFT_1025847 [Armillaria solidipes]SJK98198.1 uncharacterized protein ARMOST_01459 [Armillaria ostoyae]